MSAAPAAGQPGPVSSIARGSASISGTLIDVLTKNPVAGCMVALNQLYVSSRNAVTTTDTDGAYQFSDIADADYHVNTFCDGYPPGCYRSAGTDPPRCDTVSVVVDQRKSHIDFSLMPGANARGRVVDIRGRPIGAATVRLGMSWYDTATGMSKPTQTKPDGSFELTTLPPGKWRLEVEMPAGSDSSVRPPVVYFPGVLAEAEAGSIELVAGKTLANITIVAPRLSDNQLIVRVVTAEQTLSQLEVSFVRIEPLTTRRVPIDGSGTGTITALVPGRYFLTARGQYRDRIWTAFDAVDYFGDTQEILLYLQPAARISGRIIGEKGAAPALDGVRVGAPWIYDGVEINPLAVDDAPVGLDGTFHLDGLFGNRRLQPIGLDPSWELQSITHGRSDVTAGGLDLAPGTEANVVIVVRRR